MKCLDVIDVYMWCFSTDKGGRYAYEKQPAVCKWNCERLAFSLAQLPYMDMTELYPILDLFMPQYEATYLEIMRKKVALDNQQPPVETGESLQHICLLSSSKLHLFAATQEHFLIVCFTFYFSLVSSRQNLMICK